MAVHSSDFFMDHRWTGDLRLDHSMVRAPLLNGEDLYLVFMPLNDVD